MVLRTIFSNDAAVPRGLTRLAAKLLSGHSSVWVFVFSMNSTEVFAANIFGGSANAILLHAALAIRPLGLVH